MSSIQSGPGTVLSAVQASRFILMSVLKEGLSGNSLAVQWLGLCASTPGGTGSIPGRGTKIPQATRKTKIKERLKPEVQKWKQGPEQLEQPA